MDHNFLRNFVDHVEQKKSGNVRITSTCSFDVDFFTALLPELRRLIARVFGKEEIHGCPHIESTGVLLDQLHKVGRCMFIGLVDAISRLVIQIRPLSSASELAISSTSGGMSFAKRR